MSEHLLTKDKEEYSMQVRKRQHSLNDPVVAAVDRASQAQYQLEALIKRVEEAIFQEKEAIRTAVPLEGGVNTMSRKLLHSLQQTECSNQTWERAALGEVIALINVKKLASRIWPELLPSKSRQERISS